MPMSLKKVNQSLTMKADENAVLVYLLVSLWVKCQCESSDSMVTVRCTNTVWTPKVGPKKIVQMEFVLVLYCDLWSEFHFVGPPT